MGVKNFIKFLFQILMMILDVSSAKKDLSISFIFFKSFMQNILQKHFMVW